MTDAKDAQQDIVEKLLTLAAEQDGEAADYFKSLHDQLDAQLRNSTMAEEERQQQLERFDAARTTALDTLNADAAAGSNAMIDADEELAETETPDDGSDLLLFALSRLNQLRAPEGNSVVFDAIAGGYEIRSTVQDAADVGETAGVSIVVSPEKLGAASGRTVVVELVAKSAAKLGSGAFALVYTTGNGETSGWTRFEPSDDFERFTLTFDVSERSDETGRDHVGIWADMTGEGGGIIVDELTVTLAPEEET